jgi:energy-converting hydrogenase Eha subunit F
MTSQLSSTVTTGIVVVKTGILLFGGLITYFSFKAYRRTGAPALRALSIGFGTVTLGAILGGIVDQLLLVPVGVGLLIDATLTLVGFVIITYSMYAE